MHCPHNQLFAATKSGNNTNPDFDKPHIAFCVCLNSIRSKNNLTTAAQSHTGRRGHNRERCVFQLHQGILPFRDRVFDNRPHSGIRRKQGKPHIGTNGEVIAVMTNDKCLEAFFIQFGGLTQHGNDILVNGIHLGVKLKTGNAVAKIPDAGTFIGHKRLVAALDVSQGPGAIRDRDNGILALNRHVESIFALFLVKRTIPDFFQEGRNRHTVCFETLDKILNAKLIELFKRSIFPGITGLHGIIDRDNIIGDFAHQRRRI